MDTASATLTGMASPTTPLQSDYELFSGLFIYPQNNSYAKQAEDLDNHLAGILPEAATEMKPFIEFITHSTLQEIQELFLRSFDVQAITTLDIGFTLFGEDYKRGQLLVNMNREHREAGNDCHTELSDHLPNILRLLPKMKDETIRNEIVLRLLIPAVEKMISEFDNKKIEKKDEIYKKNLKTVIDYSPVYRTVYQSLLQALFTALRNDFGYMPESINNPSGVEEQLMSSLSCEDKIACNSCNPVAKDYSGNIEIEMNIEKY